VNVAAFQNLDLTSAPFTDTFLQGFVQINKVLHDLDGKTVVPADDSVLQGTTFVVYQDANNNGRLDSGEESTLTNDDPATCTHRLQHHARRRVGSGRRQLREHPERDQHLARQERGRNCERR
jgi:hypothetical protein